MRRTALTVTLLMITIFLAGCFGGGTIPSYSVSGVVKEAAGQPISGVKIHSTGSEAVAMTNAEGKWMISGLVGKVTVTPAHDDYTFSPTSLVVTKASQEIIFTATAKVTEPPAPTTYEVSGMIKDVTGDAVEGVKITFTFEDGATETTTTNALGEWTLDGVHGSGELVPDLESFRFDPPALSLHVTEDLNDQDFTTLKVSPSTLYVGSGALYDHARIQQAINAAVTGYTIVIAPGTYQQKLNITNKQIQLTSMSPEDEAVRDATVIEGDINIRGTGADGTSVEGLTITGGYRGVNVDVEAGTVSISHNRIENHDLDGIFGDQGNLFIIGNVILDNGAGGINLQPGVAEASIVGNVIQRNQRGITLGSLGTITLRIEDNQVGDNREQGINLWPDDASEVTISGNTISSNQRHGMYLSAQGAEVEVTHNVFEGNKGPRGAGLTIAGTASTLTISANTFVANETVSETANTGFGGAIYLYSQVGAVKVINNDFSSNVADGGRGGAVYVSTITDGETRIVDDHGSTILDVVDGKDSGNNTYESNGPNDLDYSHTPKQ